MSLTFALGAGSLFDLKEGSEYVEKIISKVFYIEEYYSDKSIEKYILQKVKGEVATDKRLEGIVQRMFEKALEQKQWKHVIGIALECRRLDVIEQAIVKSKQQEELLNYTRNVAMELVDHVDFRNQVKIKSVSV